MENKVSNWQWQFEAIGTQWVIDIYNPLLSLEEDLVLNKVKNLIEEFDKNYSRFRADSLITQIAKESGSYNLSPDAQKLFDLYKKLYDLSGGSFTPLIGSVLEQAGYDASYSLIPKTIKPIPKWEEALDYNFPVLKTTQPVVLDVGAGGKGYLIDLVGQLLDDQGLNNFCIDAGQDILYKNSSGASLDVGLENPGNIEQVIGVAKILNNSICGSSGNRRKWADFHHIIEPKTLVSPKNVIAVWVVAKEALVADALSTYLFLASPESLQSQFQFEWLILYKDYSINKSEDFPAELFVK